MMISSKNQHSFILPMSVSQQNIHKPYQQPHCMSILALVGWLRKQARKDQTILLQNKSGDQRLSVVTAAWHVFLETD